MASYEELKKRVASGGDSTSQGGERKSTYEELRERTRQERIKSEAQKVDDTYINTFLSNSSRYFDTAEEDYGKVGWGNASSSYQSRYNDWNSLRDSAEVIRNWLEANQGQGAAGYDDLVSYLDKFDSAGSSILDSFKGAQDYYAQWETEDAYNKFLADQKEYEDTKNFDADTAQKEINALESVLEEYKKLTRFTTDEEGARRAARIREQYGDEKAIKALISEKKQHLNKTKYAQKGILLSEAAYEEDFESKSGYQTTIKDNAAWWQSGGGDTQYEWINDQDGFRDAWEQDQAELFAQAGASSQSGFYAGPPKSVYYQNNYDQMTDNEVAIYNYYYAKEGRDKAQEYLDSIQEQLNYRKAEGIYGSIEESLALEMLFGVNAGLDQFKSGITALMNADADYIPSSAVQMASGMVRQDLSDAGPMLPGLFGEVSLGQAAYDAVTTGANMAPSILTSMAVGMINPAAGAVTGNVLMGASAAGNAYQEALNQGYDKSQAGLYATLIGGSEALLGELLGGISKLGGTSKFVNQMLDGVDNAFWRFAGKMGGSMASEGFEEGLQEVLSPMFENLIFHKDEDVNWGEVAYSALLGAVTAGIMEGPSTISEEVGTYKTGKQLQAADISADRLAGIGKTFSADTVAYQLAGRVDENTGAYTMGRLFNEIGATLTEQNVNDITEALVAKGMERGTAKKNAEALAYVVAGGQLTDMQIAVIEANEALAEVARTTLVDNNTTWFQRTKGYNEALMALAQEKAAPKTATAEATLPGQKEAPASDTAVTQNKSGAESLAEADIGPAKVASISSIQKGVATIKLEDGSEVNVKEADLDPDDGVLIETIASIDGISAADANFILGTLKAAPGVSAQMDSLGAKEAYKYGYYGFSQEHIAKHGVFANSLSEAQRNAIYETGRKARQTQVEKATPKKSTVAKNAQTGKVHFEGDRSRLTERQSASLTAMEKVADALGVQIHVFESKVGENGKRIGANGWYDPKDNSIHIDLHAGANGEGTMMFTLAHELTHYIRQWSPAKFKTLADFLMQEYGKKGVNVDGLVREQMRKAKRNGRSISYDTAYEEVVADSMETMLSDGKVMEKLAKLKQKDESLWQKIKDFIGELAAKIRSVYEGLAPDSVEGRYVAEMKDSIERLQELFTEALVDASENNQAGLTPGQGGKKYSFGGENARNADTDALVAAKKMKSTGVSMAEIFKETGWYQGADGKWRFEIDDSGMKFDRSGNLKGAATRNKVAADRTGARKALEAVADEETMQKVRAYDNAWILRNPQRRQALHEELAQGEYAKEFQRYARATVAHWEKTKSSNGMTVGDYLYHPELFAQYPGIESMELQFRDLSDELQFRDLSDEGLYGLFDGDKILLDESLKDEADSVLIHEIQHAIQEAEGFASGSTEAFWKQVQAGKNPRTVTAAQKRAADRRAKEALKAVPESVAKEFERPFELLETDPEQAETLAMELIQGRWGEQFNAYGEARVAQMHSEPGQARDPGELYMNTAGEIEARDVQSRKALSAKERRNRLPNTGDEMTVLVEGLDLAMDSNTESVAPSLLFSERTWTESDYVQEREKAAAEISKAIGVSKKKAKAYIDSVNSIAKMIAEDRVRLDYFSSPGRSSFVGNVEYGGSFDFSTLCKKRRLLTGTFTAIQKALPNTALTANEILDIRNRMKDAGLEVSCGLCYVEGSRANMGQFAKEFLKLYKQYYPDAWQPNMADVNTPDGIEWVRINHPECYEQYEYFWNHYGTLKPGDKNLFASQQKPKLYQLHTEYKGEILEKFNDDDNVEEKNLNGGIRLQSFSDFEIVHLIDTMQIIMDMSRVGLAGQAYTKVPDFAWALGDTGLKINLSLIAKGVDDSGKLIFDDVEGMPIADAMKLRERYSKNVGTILVAFNDAQLLAAMADERVDYIIPFHRSQWKKSQYPAMGLPAKTKDYTFMQNEKFIKPQYHEYRGRMVKDKATNYMPNEYWDFSKSGKENAVAYLEMCARNNKRPKFYKLLQNNGDGSYSLKADGSTDGYWKLLIDFKMYDNSGKGSPQMAVKPEFNMEEATRMLNDYNGGHSNFPVAQGIVDEFVKEYKDSHKGVKFSDRNTEAAELSDAGVKYSIREEAPPKKVGVAYKVFLAKDGQLYPPMVANPGGEGTPVGVWLNADIGKSAPPSKTGRPQVQGGGKGTNSGKISLAFRPGWHLGDTPLAKQFAKLNPETGKKELFPANFVWAECEYAMDVDYQEEAMSYGYTENGKFRHSYAGLPKLPADGYYRYRTNPNPDTVPWVITGAMRVKRILTDAETDAICREHGVEPMARQGGPINLADFGLEAGEVKLSDRDSRTYAEIEEERQELRQRETRLDERKRKAESDPELLKAMDDVSGLFKEVRGLLAKKRNGTATQVELDRIEEIKRLREEALNRVAALQESLGLNEIAQERDEIRDAKEALRIASDAAWAREGAERENKAIEKAGVSASEYFRKKALKAFKTTTNFNEAGYMLPDGKLLNFSGGERNHRYRDHREIGEIYEATQGAAALNRFMADGNIRIMAESPGIDITSGVEPTKEQYAALRKFINANGVKEGKFFVDFSDAEGHRAGNYSYEGRVNADRVINDIKYYYATGEIREQSSVAQFLWSDRDTESVSNRSLLANAFEGAAQNDIERKKIQAYRAKISLIEAEERKLNELTQKIRELSFAKGPKDTQTIRDLQFEAKQTANRISTYDKQLLRLEASKPLQDVLAREKQMAYKRAEKKGKEALAAYREKATKTQRALMDKWQESRKKGIESREKTAMRHKIQSVVGELNQLLLANDKKRHVPDSLKKAVADALALVNMDTVGAEERAAKYANLIAKETDPDKIDAYTVTMENILRQGEKMGQRLKELRDAYEEIQTSDDPDIANAYDPVIAGCLKELAGSIGNTSLRNMTIEQLSDVYDMYRMVLTRVRDANKTFLNDRKESISNLASRVVGEVRRVGGDHKYRAAILDPVRKFLWNNLKPVYAFEHMGSSTLTEVFDSVRAGEDTWAKDVTEARAYYLERAKKYGYDGWDFKKKYRFESDSGIPFELTLEQILSLYAYSKREQAHDHLRLGGFVFDSNIETTREKGVLKYKVNTADAHQITPEILADIIGKLSQNQMAFVDEMQEYLSSTMGAKGNEVTMKMYGVKLFKEKFYFPLKSAKQFLFEQNEVSGEVRIKNSGFTNKTVAKANNPVILSNFMDVWAGHVNDMSMYHAFVLPLEDFNRIFNYNSPKREGQPPVSVKGTIQSAYSPAAVSYVKELITDLNGGAVSDPRETTAKAMMSKFKKAKVMASMSVVIQQPSAIARAFALVNPKYFRPTKDGMNHEALWNELKKYAPVAAIKEMGYFDTNMGMSTKDYIMAKEYSGITERSKAIFMDSNYRDEALSKLPALADELTWCAIWNAVKRETVSTHKDLRPGSEEFLKAAGERFTEVVSKTQVYDSVLARSSNMRSKSGLMNMATSFMAEPTTAINMLEDAIRKGKRGDKRYAAGAFASVATSIVLNNALVSIVYAMRDDDEDETYLEKYAEAFVSGMMDDANPLTYYPFLKDMWSLLQGYDVERADMSLFSDLADAMKKLVQAYSKEDGDVAGAWWELAGTVANIGGVPLQNIRREIDAVTNFYNTLKMDLNGSETTLGSMRDALQETVRGTLPVVGWLSGETKADKLYDAIISGDTAYVERLKRGYKDESAVNTAMRSAIQEHYIAGDISYEDALSYLVNHAGMEEDDAFWKVEEWDFESESDKEFSKYDEFLTAVETGKNLKAVIKEYTDNGVSESTLKDQISEYYKPLYIEMTTSERANIKGYLLNAMTLLGDKRESAVTKIKKWEFEGKHGVAYDDIKQEFLDGNITASELRSAVMTVEGKTADEANAKIASICRDAYEDGNLTRGKAASIMVSYGGMTQAEADSKLRYIDVKKQYPDAYVDDAWVDEYYKEVENSGISIKTFIDYRNQVKDITGEGKKERRLAVIDSLPISDAQKDALYYAEGWAASKIYEAPWR